MGIRQKYRYSTIGKRYNYRYSAYIYPKKKGQAYQEGDAKGRIKLLNRAIGKQATQRNLIS